MINVRSNVKGVIGRLERFEGRLDGAVVSALRPDVWHRVLRTRAEAALEGVASPEERVRIPAFVATLMTAALPRGFAASLSTPELLADVSQAVTDVERLTMRRYGSVVRRRRVPLASTDEEQENIARVREGILEWVRTEKRRDERDEGLTDEEVAGRIRDILFDQKPTADVVAARESLLPAIQEWLDARELGLEGETIADWLLAVLEAWKDLVREQLPMKVRQEIRRVWNESGRDLL